MRNPGLARLVALLTVAMTGLPTTAATAAAGPDGVPRTIEEVIVTAERREASVQDTSISITAFTGEFLDDFGIRNQEDLQNYIPATTIQPYDATIRGVGRNFRNLGGDPGVSTYMNGVYSEDLLTATAATFFDVERLEVLRGPQGTLYGRNAVGGAINILYREPTWEYEGSVKAIAGNLGQREYYGALGGPIVPDKLAGRITLAFRDRDGVVDDIGGFTDAVDGLGTESYAVQLLFTPTDRLRMKVRMNEMDINRSFGGADAGGLTVRQEGQGRGRVTDALVGGFRTIDRGNTDIANALQSTFFDVDRATFTFRDPASGAAVEAQRIRAGIDADTGGILNGGLNAAASLDGFGITSPETAARYDRCVFNGGHISGADHCAATNGLNTEEFEQNGYQFEASYELADALSIKYLFGYSELSYERVTDDDGTGSQFHDAQFYVNHEANYRSHEIQVLYDLGERISITSGVFFYNAEIDQRGDFYSSLRNGRFDTPYTDNTGIVAGVFGTTPVTLFTARDACASTGLTTGKGELECQRDNGIGTFLLGPLQGDAGGRELSVAHGIDTPGSDLLYSTETRRDAFAIYTQAVWDINTRFSLTAGLRFAVDELKGEENLWAAMELDGIIELFGLTVADFNLANGGLVDNQDGTYTPTVRVTNGLPVGLTGYRGHLRKDKELGWRINLDYHVTDTAMVYLSATRAHRAGGNNLVYFSETYEYDPEELINYEIGYKTDWLDNTLRVNGSLYLYDYDSVHTFADEPSITGGSTTSVVAAPGARVVGVEAEVTWLISDTTTLGANFSFTPSEYTESLLLAAEADARRPVSLFGDAGTSQDIKGNQLLQVPEWKAMLWGSYRFSLPRATYLDVRASYSYIDEVFYTPFESDLDRGDAYTRLDLRATWTSPSLGLTVAAFVNNAFDDIGIVRAESGGEGEFFRSTLATTTPRAFGVELGYTFGDY